jgi:hypothetical protein
MICGRSVAGGSNKNDDAAIMWKVADNAGKEPGTGDVIRDVGSKPGTGDRDVISDSGLESAGAVISYAETRPVMDNVTYDASTELGMGDMIRGAGMKPDTRDVTGMKAQPPHSFNSSDPSAA